MQGFPVALVQYIENASAIGTLIKEILLDGKMLRLLLIGTSPVIAAVAMVSPQPLVQLRIVLSQMSTLKNSFLYNVLSAVS